MFNAMSRRLAGKGFQNPKAVDKQVKGVSKAPHKSVAFQTADQVRPPGPKEPNPS